MVIEEPDHSQSTIGRRAKATYGEDSVTLKIDIAGNQVNAVLDTGAKPSVIDYKTLTGLGFRNNIKAMKSKVFGLCQNPVQVLGGVELEVKIDQEKAAACFYFLDSEEPTLLLGREFMACFDRITFDFRNGRIRLGNVWNPIESTLTGGTPLFWARTAMSDTTIAAVGCRNKTFDINLELSSDEHKELTHLLNDYTDLSAVDPRKPG